MPRIVKTLLLLFTFLCGIAWSVYAADSSFNSDTTSQILRRISVDKSDLKTYKKIFKALAKKDHSDIDKLIDKLEDTTLLGTVLAIKYLETAYSSSVDELNDWLNKYNDNPFQPRIKRLYERKSGQPSSLNDDDTWLQSSAKISSKYLARLSRQDKIFLTKNAKEFRLSIRKGKTLNARKILENKRFQNLAPKPYWDNLGATLAIKYLVDNYDNQALEWGKKASQRHNSGMATWVAGIASWRLKKFKTAASYFAKLGSSQNSDKWLISAGAYWSARAYEKIGNTLKAQEMYKLAAQHKYTFYGILGAYQLGYDLRQLFSFDKDLYLTDFSSPDNINDIIQSQPLRRAIILMEIKQNNLAAQEIINAYKGMTDPQKEVSILMAHQKGLHSLVIAISRQADFDDVIGRYEKEIYPLPQWSQQNEWQIDKALLLAVIRQESAFKDNAASRTGARGLMQLMPNTASYISGDKTIKRHKDKLYNPDFNLQLGQKYVNYLLTKPFIEGNLFFMLSAYNAGPGNLVKWQKNSRFQGDPLLYIEVIPSSETRIYLERVLANYWIYNIRLGNPNPTLEQVAAGEWPVLEQYKQILFD